MGDRHTVGVLTTFAKPERASLEEASHASADGPRVQPQPSPPAMQAGGPIRTFLVEDRAEIRDTLVAAMEEMTPIRFVGHASTEREARDWLAAHPHAWDLAIIDLYLAEGSGFGVLHDCAARKAGQKVIVLTSYSRDHVLQKCLQLGANRVFDKSQDIARLVDYCRSSDHPPG